MKINKQVLFFLLFFYFFLFKAFLEKQISILKYADELAALIAVPIFLVQMKRDRFKLKMGAIQVGYGRYIVLMMIVGAVSSLRFRYQPVAAALSDAFLNVKFWLAIYVGKSFIPGFLCQRNAKDVFAHIKLMTWFYVTMVAMDTLFKIFPADIRYGLRSIQLFYPHPTYFVNCCIFLISILLSIRDWINGSEKYLAILLLLMCTTLRSKAFGIACTIALIYYFAYIRKKKITVRTVALFAPVVVALSWEQIEYYFFSSIQNDSARYQLLVKSIQVANDHFPFGGGFATYASYYSAVYYSPFYERYGLSTVNGLRPDGGAFISDSFWPMILGQFGWLGLICYCAALLALFMRIQKMREYSKAIYTSGLSILVHLLITSTGESAFVHPLAIPLAIWLGILFQTRKPEKLP